MGRPGRFGREDLGTNRRARNERAFLDIKCFGKTAGVSPLRYFFLLSVLLSVCSEHPALASAAYVPTGPAVLNTVQPFLALDAYGSPGQARLANLVPARARTSIARLDCGGFVTKRTGTVPISASRCRLFRLTTSTCDSEQNTQPRAFSVIKRIAEVIVPGITWIRDKDEFAFIEAVAVTLLLALALCIPSFIVSWLAPMERALSRLARKPALAAAAVGLLALGARLAALPVLPTPEPTIDDEFSYLLAADTFASGRVTNLTHPLWTHFETFHVLQQPTYMSMYPPGQGLVLAAGTLIGGHPWVGVWISTALACASICWMLQGWLPPSWALLGGLLVVLRLGVFSYWMNSYWGGSLAAIGGALAMGAFPRIVRQPRVTHAALMALGLVILASTRPWEGLILSIPLMMALFCWIMRTTSVPPALLVRKILLPFSFLIGLAAVAMGYYFWRVTGNPFRMPHELNRATYAVAPLFVWQAAKQPPLYRHVVIRDFYVGTEMVDYNQARSVGGFVARTWSKVQDFRWFFLGPALTVPLIALPWLLRDHRIRLLLVVCAFMAAGVLVEVWTFPHYVAPATCVVYAILLQGMRHLRLWRWSGRPIGKAIVAGIPAICLLVFVVRAEATTFHIKLPSSALHSAWGSVAIGTARTRILRELDHSPGMHLVIVRYGPCHDPTHEWVYNRADIDRSRVIWVRDMGAAGNEELIAYFHDRHVWLVEPDESPISLVPYRRPQS